MVHPKMIRDFDPKEPTCPRCKAKLKHLIKSFPTSIATYHANMYRCTCGTIVTVVIPTDPTQN